MWTGRLARRGMSAHTLFHLRYRKVRLQSRSVEFSISRTSDRIRCKLNFGMFVTYAKDAYPPYLSSSFPSVQGATRHAKLAYVGPRLPPPSSTDNLSQRPYPALGNLYLSSCPGKKGGAHVSCCLVSSFTDDVTTKVRLTGPVRGRGAICRDVKQDLRRIKALGIGCIVWCAKI